MSDSDDDRALWLRVHRPVLDELHDVQSSLRSHALAVGRITRSAADQAGLDAALTRLEADCERLARVCRVLASSVPPPTAAARRFQDAVSKLSGAARAPSLGALVTKFEDGSNDLQQVEAELEPDGPATG